MLSSSKLIALFIGIFSVKIILRIFSF